MQILSLLLEITVYSAVIFVITVLLKTTLKNKMSPFLHYAVWFVLILRLMLPVTIESSYHVFTAPALPKFETSADVQPQAESAVLPQTNSVGSSFTLSQVPSTNTVSDEAVTPVMATPSAQPAVPTLSDILLTVWLSGTGICLLYLIAVYGKLRRKIDKKAAPPTERLLSLFEQVKAELGIRARLRLVCQYEYGTPALLFPRTVLMPIDALVAMDDEQVRFALRHELMHYKRGDHIVCLALSALNAVYWFNPIVWLALRQIRLDMETACDGAVVKRLDTGQRNRYASLIVKLFAQPIHRQLVLGMAQENMRKVAERRVRGIFMRGRSGRSATVLSALLAVILAVTCFTTACQPALPMISITEPAAKTHMNAVINPNDNLTINVDADVFAPEDGQYPTVRLKPLNLSVEQFDAITKRLTDNKPLYFMSYAHYMTKEEYDVIIPKLKGYLSNASLEPYEKSTLSDHISMLEEDREKAKTLAEEKPYDGKLSETTDNSRYSTITYLRCHMDKDAAAMINFYQSFDGTNTQLVFSNSNYAQGYSSYEPYTGVDAPRIDMSYEEAKAMAEKLVREFDGADTTMALYESSIGYRLHAYEGYTKDTAPQSYMFQFARCYQGMPVKPVASLYTSGEGIEFDKTIAPESMSIIIDSDGLLWYSWLNHTKYIEDIQSDASLMDFEDIQDIFQDYWSNPTVWKHPDEMLPADLDIALNVKRIELNLMPIPEDENMTSYKSTPVWDFIADMDFGKEVFYEDGAPIEPQKNISILTINALTGEIISREQGY